MYVSGRSNRTTKPNLKHTTILENGMQKRIVACTRCMRTMRKQRLPRQ